MTDAPPAAADTAAFRGGLLRYTALRLVTFLVPFAVLLALQVTPWIAAVWATVLGFAISYVFLSTARNAASTSIYRWRTSDRSRDDIDEDDAIDGQLEAPNQLQRNPQSKGE